MIPFAFSLTETPVLILKGLAVLLGAFVGAFVVGLVVKLIVGLARPKPMSGWAVAFVRLAGAGGGGFLTWFLIANLSFGLGKGEGKGEGKGDGKDKEARKDDKPAQKDKVEPPKDDDKRVSKDDKPLHVFVLGLKDLEDRLKTKTPNIDNCYWIQGDPQTQVRDLDDLKKELRGRQKKDAKLKVYMDGTANSPDRDNPHYSKPLERWLRDEKLFTPDP